MNQAFYAHINNKTKIKKKKKKKRKVENRAEKEFDRTAFGSFCSFHTSVK
jgi:hypothetical protein